MYLTFYKQTYAQTRLGWLLLFIQTMYFQNLKVVIFCSVDDDDNSLAGGDGNGNNQSGPVKKSR